DADTGTETRQTVLLPSATDGSPQWAAFDGDHNLLHCSDNTWPALAWVSLAEDDRRVLPVENVAPEVVTAAQR
ncbi:MAG: hypothetical protein KDB24_13730, partial [Microthrixaceae bacterium]|nr:hypothetical protein [Microthrixaceae bacterium]